MQAASSLVPRLPSFFRRKAKPRLKGWGGLGTRLGGKVNAINYSSLPWYRSSVLYPCPQSSLQPSWHPLPPSPSSCSSADAGAAEGHLGIGPRRRLPPSPPPSHPREGGRGWEVVGVCGGLEGEGGREAEVEEEGRMVLCCFHLLLHKQKTEINELISRDIDHVY